MSSPARARTVDRQEVTRKLVNILKKRYKASASPKKERPVLETLLFAVCLEDASVEQAEVAFDRMLETFHDLNEIRVSSISELAQVFNGMPDPEWRAARIRAVLHYVFEKHFEFAFEALRRKTLDLATKQLTRIKDLSPFVRNYALQSALGSHLVPVDQQMTNAAIWLGLVPPGEGPQQAGDMLKVVVRKADTQQFCHLLKCLACDPKLQRAFDPEKFPAPAGGWDLASAPERLEHLFKHGVPARKAARAKGAKTARTRKPERAKSERAVARKSAAKPAAGRKTTRRTPAARKK